jgi:hypothetical protein
MLDSTPTLEGYRMDISKQIYLPSLAAGLTYDIDTYATFPYTINDVYQIQTSSGTVTAAVKINGTAVTGLSSISVSSTAQNVAATGANSVAVGDRVQLVFSSNSGAQNINMTLAATRNVGASGNGQLQLSSSTQVALMPFNGNQVYFPDGTSYTIPSAGLASGSVNGGCHLNGTASSTLAANTLYYVYLWENSGSPVLDFSTTGHATDSSTGIEIKSGDNTRVLVGMVYPQAGPTVVDSGAKRLVASWFNRQPKMATGSFTANRTSTATSGVEINSEIGCSFLSWGDNAICQFSGSGTTSIYECAIYSFLMLDNSIYFGGTEVNTITAGEYSNISFPASVIPDEGEHYLTLFGRTDPGATATWYGAGAPYSCELFVTAFI